MWKKIRTATSAGRKACNTMGRRIRIILNGFPETVPENTTISDLIDRFEENDGDLIVEHNGQFVYPQKYAVVTASEGDRVEFINPNFGG